MGISKLLGRVEDVLESGLSKAGRYVAHATLEKGRVAVSVEDWTEHDPSVGIFGGPVCEFGIEVDERGSPYLTDILWAEGVDEDQKGEIREILEKIEAGLLSSAMRVFMRP